MNLKTGFLYFSYTLAAFAFFGILLFPEKETARILSQQINKISGNINVAVDRVTPSLPWGVCIQDGVVLMENGLTIIVDSLKIQPNMLSLFSSRKKIAFTASVYEGKIKGVATSFFSLKNPLNEFGLEARFSDIHLTGFPISSSQGEILLSLKLQGECTVNTQEISGTLTATGIKALMEETLIGQLGLSSFSFDGADFEWTLKKKRLVITDFKASGPELMVTMDGTVLLKSAFEKSRLNFTGKFRPEAALISKFSSIASVVTLFQKNSGGEIPFKLTGTPEKPKFSL